METRQATVFDSFRILDTLHLAEREFDESALKEEIKANPYFRWFLGTEGNYPSGVLRFELFEDSKVALSTLVATTPFCDAVEVESSLFRSAADLLTKSETWIEAVFDEGGILLTERALGARRKIPQLHPAFLPCYENLAGMYGFESAKIDRSHEAVDTDGIQLPDATRLLVSAYEPEAQAIALHFGYWPALYLPAFHLLQGGTREDRILVTRSGMNG